MALIVYPHFSLQEVATTTAIFRWYGGDVKHRLSPEGLKQFHEAFAACCSREVEGGLGEFSPALHSACSWPNWLLIP